MMSSYRQSEFNGWDQNRVREAIREMPSLEELDDTMDFYSHSK